MSNSNSSYSPDAQRLLALLLKGKLLTAANGERTIGQFKFPSGVTHVTSSRGVYAFHSAEDKILQLPIADEDRLFSYYEDMKVQLAEDSTNLQEPALQLAKNTKALAEMRMAVIEVQMGCYIEVLSTLWPDYVKARLLAEDARATSEVLSSLPSSTELKALDCDRWQEQEIMVHHFMTKARPFVERNSSHRQSIKEFLENPAKVFPQTSSVS